MRNLIVRIYNRALEIRSVHIMALASSIGVFTGMFPQTGLRTVIMLAISILLHLNIILILIGMLTTLVLQAIIPVNSVLNAYVWWVAPLASYPIFYMIYKLYITRHISINHNVQSYIFQDKSGKRGSLIKVFGNILLITCLTVSGMFGTSIINTPSLPDIGLGNSQDISADSSSPINSKSSTANNDKNQKTTISTDDSDSSSGITDKKILAFYVSWDDQSLQSLKANHNLINIIVPDWYTLDDKLQLKANIKYEAENYIKSNNIQEIPMINNYINGKWDSDILHKLLKAENRENFIEAVISSLKLHSYSGINLDFENIKEEDKNAYVSLVKELYSELRKNNLELIIDLPPSDKTLDYKTLSRNCSYVVLMNYDEHYIMGEPGPLASFKWSKDCLAYTDIPSDKLLGGIGNYGCDWSTENGKNGEAVSYKDLMGFAASGNINIKWDKNSQNPYITYKKDNIDHEVWFLDGTTFYNQAKATLETGAAGIAMWRLGSEDPTIWKVVKNLNSISKSPREIGNINLSSDVKYSGDGELFYVETGGKDGYRNINLDSDGYISDVSYTSIPSEFYVKCFGKQQNKVIALTFDGGPDVDTTPKILDILSKYKVQASFFIIGQSAAKNPDIMKRIYNEGHDIGNLTFTQPDIKEISPERIKAELNTTQRLIQAYTGHSTILFRPPYIHSSDPLTPKELNPILKVQELGYVMTGYSIDPLDWQGPSAETINKRISDNLDKGNIVLLHDSGSNRDEILKALPALIENMQKQGYTFVPVSQLMNKSRDEVMAPIKALDRKYTVFDKAVFNIVYNWNNLVILLFYSAQFLGVMKLAMFISLSWLHKRRSLRIKEIPAEKNGVSVVIAAYNEEKVICKTVDSVLSSNYDKLEIVIVNDGSTDNTLEVLTDRYSNNNKVKILSKKNGGKTLALNLGFKEASHDIILTIDADTILDKDAILYLASHFNDPKMAAVAGNIKAGNINNALTIWQHLEYTIGFNLEKRALTSLQCITVVPGAIGAFRKSVIKSCGYFSSDTLAEDTDMTLQLVKSGYKVGVEERAIAYTEVPENLKSLVKQRIRWSYGTLQCMWKHKEALFNKKHKFLGFIAMPHMWIFQYIFLPLSPIADIYFIFGIFGKFPAKIIMFYVLYFLLDLISAVYALNLEKGNKVSIFWLTLQRIIYRWIMAYTVITAIVSAVAGKLVGWNKLKRTGSVVKNEAVVE